MDLPRTSANGSDTRRLQTDPIADILKVIREGERFLVCSHSRPDGDAVGSMLAMGMLLKKWASAPTWFRPIAFRLFTVRCPGRTTSVPRCGYTGPTMRRSCWSATGWSARGCRDWRSSLLINIDHHATGLEFAHINWIDHQAACVGEMVYRLFLAADVEVTPDVATCIYTTVLTDTGGFIYGGTRASTFGLARDLTLAGADPIRIAQQVYFSTSMAKLLLLGAALRNLHREGRLAWLWITHEDMVRSCAVEEDCEGIANYALSIAEVEAAVFLRELPENRDSREPAQQRQD